jgi:hypothetical protein
MTGRRHLWWFFLGGQYGLCLSWLDGSAQWLLTVAVVATLITYQRRADALDL